MPKSILLLALLSLLLTLSLWPVSSKAEGEQLFQNNCMACHQADGKGIVQVYPALAGSEIVNGSAQDVVLILLVGRGDMPSFKDSFTNEEMAQLINYVRNAWGNQGEHITSPEVEKIRQNGF